MTVKKFCEKYKISHQAVYAKIRKKKNLLDGHIFKDGYLVLEILQKQLAEQISKNADLIKSVERLSEEITEKSKIIDKLQSEAAEQLNQKPKKLFGKN